MYWRKLRIVCAENVKSVPHSTDWQSGMMMIDEDPAELSYN